MQTFDYTIPEGKTIDDILPKMKKIFDATTFEGGAEKGDFTKEGLVGSYEVADGKVAFTISKLPVNVPFQYVVEIITNTLNK